MDPFGRKKRAFQEVFGFPPSGVDPDSQARIDRSIGQLRASLQEVRSRSAAARTGSSQVDAVRVGNAVRILHGKLIEAKAVAQQYGFAVPDEETQQ